MAVVALVAVLSSCASSKKVGGTVPYVVADHYFFRNDAQIPADARIATQEQFDSLFGMAPVMGEGGLPTAIDFSRQFVIAVVKPETQYDTTLQPLLLKDDGRILTLGYKTKVGSKMSYSTQPCMILVVDRKYDRGSVQLNGH